MKITEPWLHAPETQAVCDALERGGHQALFVGGCVRNALLGVEVSDIDLSTDARPERVIELVEAAGLKAVPTGIDHGTVTVVSGHVPHEVTTFRRDVETFGRHAVVAYADSAEEDAHRRDFTMNALYADARGQVIDPLGGLKDLEVRRVRFIDDAEARIKEDYLRILRFFRFHAWYGDHEAGLDPDGLAACAAFSAGIETLSKERVGAEVKRLLAALNPAPSVAAMAHAGVLSRAVPGADPRWLPVLVHLEHHEGITPDPVRRLACIGGENLAENLRLSRAEARRIVQLRATLSDGAGASALGHALGQTGAMDALLLRAALTEQPMPPDWRKAVAFGAAQVFPVKAADLMAEYQGPALGARLKELENRWIASGFSLSRDDLLASE